ncbi:MAG: ComEC/Rec2 family competence protein, partial [Pseudomonadota bacterium]
MKVTHALVVVIACALLPIIAPLPSVVCVYVLLVVSVAVQLLRIKRWRHTRQWNDSHSLSILCLLAMQCSLCHLAYIDWIQLPDDWTPTKVTLTAEVMSLPKQVDYDQYSVQQFVARVVSIEQPLNATRMPASHVSVNWYNHDTNVKVGERWAFTLTIKNPRSLANEGAFNYRLWLLSQGITATGNVVNAERLASAESVWTINGLRERFRDKLLSYADVTQQDLILAVSIGDRSLMSHERWASFSDTGTSHLVAISGLHIGLFSALLYWLIKGLLIVWRTPLRYLPNTSWAAIMSLIFTGMYVLLSGMAIPAQRA